MDNVSMAPKLARMFMAIGFIYLFLGSLLLALRTFGIIQIEMDSIFIMELYGFVTMLIFGLSYMFAPGLSHTSYANYKVTIAELILLNIGIILIFSAMSGIAGQAKQPATLLGFSSLLLAIAMHSVSIWHIIGKNKKPQQP
ncbi:MAG: hypothetical protein KGI00_01935 [Candidatus Micrarchaeota archaeon]|nr:hypothetical protein [Candidatus Micrarchaeota archaeon]MDE1849469.1 hypothetical protein [Candidatus Micrarchaeota archaeon]